MIQNTTFTHDFYSTTEPLLKLHSHTHTLTALFPAEQSEPCMLSWSCDARGAVMLNELTTVLLSGTFSWRPLVLLSPEAGLWIMHVRARALSSLRHIHRSCYLSWHILSRVIGQHVACWTVLHTAQTTTDRFWFQKQSNESNHWLLWRTLGENVIGGQ